jgi:hypothetical protein
VTVRFIDARITSTCCHAVDASPVVGGTGANIAVL